MQEHELPPVVLCDLGQALATVAPEIRSPLYAILGQLEPLMEQHHAIRRPTLGRVLRSLHSNARLLEHNLDDLLCGLELLFGRSTLAPTVVPLARLIEEAAAEASVLVGDKEHTLSLVLPAAEAGAAVWVDRSHMVRAIAGLLAYAIAATPCRGCVTLSATAGDGEWRLCIEAAEGIWSNSPMADANASGDRRGQLALVVARRIIVLSGGSVALPGDSGSGGALWLSLPARPVKTLVPLATLEVAGEEANPLAASPVSGG